MGIRASVNKAEGRTFRNGHAFLGYYQKAPDVRYALDGERLVCWHRLQYYIKTTIGAVFLGPLLTVTIVWGPISPEGWFAWILIVAFNLLGWAMLVEAIRTRSRVVFDFAKQQMFLFIRVVGEPTFSLDLDQILQVESNSFYRPTDMQMGQFERLDSPDEWHGSVVQCHELAVRTDQGETLTLLETTEAGVIQEVKEVLELQLVLGKD